MHDIVIIGAGPAGLTAAIYARRAGKTVLVLEKDTFGGQVTFSPPSFSRRDWLLFASAEAMAASRSS